MLPCRWVPGAAVCPTRLPRFLPRAAQSSASHDLRGARASLERKSDGGTKQTR